KLKEELEKLGFFDVSKKKPIPQFPSTIGVITSATGAAVRDIINTISRRYPLCKMILYPAIVQGADAKFDIVKQIKKANSDNLCDVLIVGRGGGSIEDLWAFNERIVAEAIFESKIPIISAVGHEVDFTIADFVADKRAATPTAAAELATPSIDVLKENIKYYDKQMSKLIINKINDYKLILSNLDKRIDSNNPVSTLKHQREIVTSLSKNLNLLIYQLITDKKHRFKLLSEKLEILNPLSIMDKGYAINKIDGKVISDVKKVNKGDIITTTLKNGEILSEVIDIIEK
ncbi:MAG: exodeoxyribonuclease VII large subunit, partial [Acholeplasmatales bacterium]|nr:exodeoxyribonuclease VII large subunit [Acholeplasmatales bacterium]